jgi:ubiquitin C-terminal hydrolase
LISCLYSINRLEKEFLHSDNNKFNNKNITPISCAFYNCLNAIKDNTNFISAIKNFRRYFGTKNPKLDGDKEINPFYLIIFLVENMHKELNVRLNNELDENQGYLIKRKEDKTNKADMVLHFLRYYKENFNSIISKTFFGIMKYRNNCKECGLITYSFNFFCLLYFDIDKITQKSSTNKITLMDFFNELKKGNFSSNSKKKYFCKGCSKQTEHGLQKAIYYMPNSLIICFRYNNDNSDIIIDYPDSIDLDEEKEYPNSPGKFNLRGFINKIDENGNERYVSYFKSQNNEKIFSCENDSIKEENSWNKNNGKSVMLFYEAV